MMVRAVQLISIVAWYCSVLVAAEDLFKNVHPDTLKLHRTAGDPLMEDIDKLEDILDAGKADINYKHPQSGQTPLMAACLKGNAKTAKFLLDKKADVTVPEKDGYNCPHGAGFQGHPEVMRVLFKGGFDVNIPHADGFLPFHRACWGREPRHTELIKAMVEEMGVDPAVPTAASSSGAGGQTCLQMTSNPGTRQYLMGRTTAGNTDL